MRDPHHIRDAEWGHKEKVESGGMALAAAGWALQCTSNLLVHVRLGILL